MSSNYAEMTEAELHWLIADRCYGHACAWTPLILRLMIVTCAVQAAGAPQLGFATQAPPAPSRDDFVEVCGSPAPAWIRTRSTTLSQNERLPGQLPQWRLMGLCVPSRCWGFAIGLDG